MNRVEHIKRYKGGCLMRSNDITNPVLPNLLFVRGFGTNMEGDDAIDIYKYIQNYFIGKLSKEYNVYWFEYTPTDKVECLVSTLDIIMKEHSPKIVIGHSLGGCNSCSFSLYLLVFSTNRYVFVICTLL